MQAFLSIFFILFFNLSLYGQTKIQDTRKHFEYTDTSFEVGEVKIIRGLDWFDVGQAYLTHPIIDSLATFLYYNPELQIDIAYYTSARGSDKYNMRLSEARAEGVYSGLISDGISKDRITYKGYGESAPIVPIKINGKNNPDEQWINSRAEIKITAIDKYPEKFTRPALLNPGVEAIHFLFGGNASAFPLTLFHVRDIDKIIDSYYQTDTTFSKQYRAYARSYLGFINSSGDTIVMATIDFSSFFSLKRNAPLFNGNSLAKTQIIFINLSKKVWMKPGHN